MHVPGRDALSSDVKDAVTLCAQRLSRMQRYGSFMDLFLVSAMQIGYCHEVERQLGTMDVALLHDIWLCKQRAMESIALAMNSAEYTTGMIRTDVGDCLC
jgi:hypothetical protein